eukprot:Rmarinus@m.3088
MSKWLQHRGKTTQKYHFEVVVLSLRSDGSSNNAIEYEHKKGRELQVVWSRGAKVSMTRAAQFDSGAYRWDQKLSMVSTLYQNKSGSGFEPKVNEFRIKDCADAKKGGSKVLGSCNVDLAQYADPTCSGDGRDVTVDVKMKGGVGKLSLTIRATWLKNYESTADDALSQLTDLTTGLDIGASGGSFYASGGPTEDDVEKLTRTPSLNRTSLKESRGSLSPMNPADSGADRATSDRLKELEADLQKKQRKIVMLEKELENGQSYADAIERAADERVKKAETSARDREQDLSEKLKQASEENARLRSELARAREDLHDETRNLDTRLADSGRELEKMKEAASRAEEAARNMSATHRVKAEECANLQRRVDELEDELNELSSVGTESAAKLESKVVDLHIKLAAKDREILELTNQVTGLSVEVSRLEQEKQCLEAAALAKAGRPSATAATAGDVLREKYSGRESGDGGAESSAKTIELQARVAELEQSLAAAKAEKERIPQLESQLANAREKITQLQSDIDEDEAYKRLEDENADLETRIESLKRQLYESERRAHPRESDEYEDRIQLLESELHEVRSTRTALEKEVATLRGEIESLRSRLRDAQAHSALGGQTSSTPVPSKPSTADSQRPDDNNAELIQQLIEAKIALADNESQVLELRNDLARARDQNLKLAEKMTNLQTQYYLHQFH